MVFLPNLRKKIELLEEYDAAKALMSVSIALIMLCVMSIALPLRIKLSPLSTINYIHIAFSYIFLLSSLFFSFKNPKNILSGYLVLSGVSIIIAPASFYFGGLKTPGVTLFVLMPIIASFLVSSRASIIFFALNLIFLFSIFLLWEKGMLQEMSPSFLRNENLIRLIAVSAAMCLSFGISVITQKVPKDVISELKQIYDSHPDGIAKINNHGKIIYSNASFKNLFKITGDNVEEVFQKHFNGKINLHEVWNSQDIFQVNSSSDKILIVNFKPFKTISSNQGLIFFTDITLVLEKNKIEKMLAEKNAKARLIATYNHELNNPLMIAMGFAKKLDKETNDHSKLMKLNSALKRMDEVLKEIDHIN